MPYSQAQQASKAEWPSRVDEVRPCPTAWILGAQSSYEAPGARITYVDVATGLFNAKFGGDIEEPLWDWSGPIQFPTALPARL